MRQSKYNKPLLQQESIGNSDGEQQVANFENRVELGAEGDRLAELIANVKDLIIEVKDCENALADAKVQCRFAVSALYSSASKVSGSAASFDKSVERLGKIRIDCKVSPLWGLYRAISPIGISCFGKRLTTIRGLCIGLLCLILVHCVVLADSNS